MIRGQIIGGDEVMAALLSMAQAFPHATSDAALAGAQVVEGKAKKEGFRQGTVGEAFGAPVAGKLTSRTGYLRASIRSEPAGRGAAAVGPAARYGAIHEFGGKTSPHTITPKRAKALRFQIGNKVIYAKRVRHPGSNIPPRPYLRPAYETHRDLVTRVMMDTIAQRIAQSGGGPRA